MISCYTDFSEQIAPNEKINLLEQDSKQKNNKLFQIIHKGKQGALLAIGGGVGLVAIEWLKRSFLMFSSSTSALLDYYTHGLSGFSPISPKMYWYYCAESCLYFTGAAVVIGGVSYLIVKNFSKEIS